MTILRENHEISRNCFNVGIKSTVDIRSFIVYKIYSTNKLSFYRHNHRLRSQNDNLCYYCHETLSENYSYGLREYFSLLPESVMHQWAPAHGGNGHRLPLRYATAMNVKRPRHIL